MDTQNTENEIRALVQPVIEEARLELVDLILVQSRFKPTLRILADRIEGGITVAECAALNRKIETVLDAHNFFSAGYLLEVASPGVDRVLSTARDFERCLHKEVRFFLKEQVQGKLEWMGIIKGVCTEGVRVECQGNEVMIPLLLINKARQEL